MLSPGQDHCGSEDPCPGNNGCMIGIFSGWDTIASWVTV